MNKTLKTTRPVRMVRNIEDIRAIETQDYDELITAHNLYDLFMATADRVGDRKALTVLRSCEVNDVAVSLTHSQLLEEITRSANMFRSLGLAPSRGVAAFLTPTLPEFPALLLGAQVAGVASSLNYLLSQEAIADLLVAEGATILVIPAKEQDAACWDKAQGSLGKVPALKEVLVIGAQEELPEGFRSLDSVMEDQNSYALNFDLDRSRSEVCALFHTGGTTGRPKLVQLTHGNQIHAAFGFAQVFGFDENDTVINGFPLFHVGGTMSAGLSVLAAGGHMVIPSPYAMRPASVVEKYWELVTQIGATVVSGVPTTIASLTRSFTPGTDVSKVRMAATGGAILPAAVGSKFQDVTGIQLYETYGMTETAAAIAFNPGRGTPVAGSVGFRAPWSETRIVRLDDCVTLCDAGESGLVQVKGPQIFPGYVEEKHNIGTLSDDGWLTTGDIGYLTEDERLVLTGREKDLIVRGGHNIDPAAIEDVVNAFPGVQISAAVGMPDAYAGEVPLLFVIPETGVKLDTDALQKYLDSSIHEPPARPKGILLLDSLPQTAVGKIFKPGLRDAAIQEKVRQEVERQCNNATIIEMKIAPDSKGATQVEITLNGATPDQLLAIEEALKPLPQTYSIHNQDEPVLLTVKDGIATLILNRPESLNAASTSLMETLESKLQQLAHIDNLRVIILTGNGRAFSAGGDLGEFRAALKIGGDLLIDTLRYNQNIIGMIENLPVPVIGVANGLAVAGGLEILLACDIILAADTARFGDGHTKYGVVPAGGASVRLEERIGPGRAAQMFYTAMSIDAQTALNWRLVNEVLPHDKLRSRAQELATQISACSPEAQRQVKKLRQIALTDTGRKERFKAEISAFCEHINGTDLDEGLEAFVKKRKPVY